MPHPDNIRSLFDTIAGDYDFLNHLLSLGADRRWRRLALREIVAPEQPQRILDLACGTGDFSIAIARKMAAGSQLTGLDLSEGMLAIMRKKLARKGLEAKIRTLCGDACATGLPDASFDRITIAFGIRNFPDREAGLREVLRLLRPGGKIVILELSVSENPVIGSVYKLYFKHILPIIGGAVSGDWKAYRYLPASVLAFPNRTQWMETMRRCGFADVKHRALSLGICRMYVGTKNLKP